MDTNSLLEYCAKLGMGEALIAVVNGFHSQAISLAGNNQPADFFIAESTKNDRREYLSLYFFFGQQVVEVENFTTSQPSFYVKGLREIEWVQIWTHNYQLGTGKSESPAFLRAQVRYNPGVQAFVFDMFASEDNCDKLYDVLKRYIMPSIL